MNLITECPVNLSNNIHFQKKNTIQNKIKIMKFDKLKKS